MELFEKQTSILSQILEKLNPDTSLNEDQLTSILNYLFQNEQLVELHENNILMDDVEYLKKLVRDKKFVSIDELEDYYESLRTYIDDFFIEQIEDCKTSATKPSIFISSTNEGLTTVRQLLSLLIEDITPKKKAINHFETVEDNLTRRFYDCSKFISYRNSSFKKFLTFDVDGYDKFESRLLWNYIDINYVGFQSYLQQFSTTDTGIIVLLINERPTASSWVKAELEYLDAHQRLIPYSNDYEDYYAGIINVLNHEERILDKSFKKSLSSWMFYSKIRNQEFRIQHIGRNFSFTRKNEPAPIVLSMDSLPLVNSLNDHFEKLLLNKKWKILKSPDSLSWITTDNPGFSIDKDDLDNFEHIKPDPLWKSISKDTIIYFPLSKYYCLRIEPLNNVESELREEDDIIDFSYTSESEIKVVNALARKTKPRLLIAGNRNELDKEAVFKLEKKSN